DRKADRPHADGLGGHEVARLVDEDQDQQPGDRDELAPAATPPASPARRRARRSVSSTCSTDSTGSASICPSTRSTTSAMPGNGRGAAPRAAHPTTTVVA